MIALSASDESGILEELTSTGHDTSSEQTTHTQTTQAPGWLTYSQAVNNQNPAHHLLPV